MDISAAKDVINMYIEMINKEMAEENRTANNAGCIRGGSTLKNVT